MKFKIESNLKFKHKEPKPKWYIYSDPHFHFNLKGGGTSVHKYFLYCKYVSILDVRVLLDYKHFPLKIGLGYLSSLLIYLEISQVSILSNCMHNRILIRVKNEKKRREKRDLFLYFNLVSLQSQTKLTSLVSLEYLKPYIIRLQDGV